MSWQDNSTDARECSGQQQLLAASPMRQLHLRAIWHAKICSDCEGAKHEPLPRSLEEIHVLPRHLEKGPVSSQLHADVMF